ncbi:MAG: mechanosensitive ion channel family protein [Acidimicrobiales bacterium]
MLQQVPNDLLTATCGEDPSFICRWVLERTESRSWAEFADIVFAKPLTITLIAAVAFVVHRLLDRVINRFVGTMSGEHPPARRLKRRLRRTAIGQRLPEGVLATGSYSARSAARGATLGVVLKSLAGFIIWTIASITVLGELGINLGALVASAGIAGLALGFGAQSLVRDFLAGLFILVEDQYGVGDVLDAGELAGTPIAGTVEAVSLRTTRLRDVDGTVWHVPNGQILRVGNKSQQWRRALLDVVVGPTADLDVAQQVVKDAADSLWKDPKWERRVLGEPELVGIEAIAAEGTTVQVILQTLPDARLGVLRELRARVKRALDDAGVPPPLTVAAAPAAKKGASPRAKG